MTCQLKRRRDDIPKRSRSEKTWVCDECGAVIFASVKPNCRAAVLAEVGARSAAAQADVHNLHLDDKVKP